MPLTEEQSAWMQRVMGKLGGQIGSPERGRPTKDLGAKYQGEERGAGWRMDQAQHESDEAFAARVARGDVVTRHYSPQEAADNTLQADAAGRVTRGDGAVPQGTMLYAMDPGTGAVVVANAGYRVAEKGPDGKPTGTLLPTRDFDTDAVAAVRSAGTKRVENTHHSTMLAGTPVAAAGMVSVQGGKVTDVSNASGHYRPEFVHLLQAVEALMKSGAMLDTEIVDGDGREVRIANPRAFFACQKVHAMQADLLRERPKIERGIERADDPMLSDDERAGIDAYLEKCLRRMEKAEKAAEILRRMGIGPRNRVAGQVKVVSAPAGTTDEAFRDGGKSIALPAGEFLAGTARPQAEAEDHPVRASAPRDAVNAQFKAQAAASQLRPEDQQGLPAGTIAERNISAQERNAILNDLQAEMEEAEKDLEPLAGAGQAGSPAGAASAGYDVVNMPVLPGNDDDDNAGGQQEAPAPAGGYGNVPQAEHRANPSDDDDDDYDAPLPNPPGDATDDGDAPAAGTTNLPAEGSGYARVSQPE